LKGTWADWVPEKFEGKDAEFGRFNFFWARDEKGQVNFQDPYKWEDVKDQEYFTAPQKVKDQVMIHPYLDGVNGEKVLLTSLSAPIFRDGEFIGAIGCDFGITSIQNILEKSPPFGKGISRLITDEGKIAADPDSNNLTKEWPIESEVATIKEKMKSGESFYLNSFEPSLKEEAVKYFSPIKMGRTPGVWYYVSIVPMSALKKESNTLFIYQVGGAVVVTLLIATLVWVMISVISKKIEAITENVGRGAEEIISVSQNLGETQNDLSSISQQQAELVTQTSNSINEITNTIELSAKRADESNELLRDCRQKGEKGNEIVSEMLNSIIQIRESNISMTKKMEENFEEINSIVQVINVIQEKTNVINDIVFQTKLLAFNASVEAARAGDLGKGFAVVAEEVGNLANMSGQASKEITEIILNGSQKIKDIISHTKSANEQMSQDNLVVVDKGSLAAKKCGEVLSEIIEGVESVAVKSTEIRDGTIAQNREAKDINQSMKTLDNVSVKSMEITGNISKTVVMLGQQSESLSHQVLELNKIIRG
jgi:methyl-accepting chemotaxis protein